MKKTRKSGRNVKQSTENTTQKTSTSTSGVQQLKMKIEIELESSLFNKWQKLRTGEGMASDTDIVSFLIQQFHLEEKNMFKGWMGPGNIQLLWCLSL
ncbi:hypothetical protein BaRGS_00033014 [Batillaria attramentaria]|uniref:Uncharacterized protein n=1 Tax=Batillaria attramentaria TaxID=370345 RepID=A0ABD0JMM5_9CAEN